MAQKTNTQEVCGNRRDVGLGLLNVPIEMQLIAKGLIIIVALTISSRDG